MASNPPHPSLPIDFLLTLCQSPQRLQVAKLDAHFPTGKREKPPNKISSSFFQNEPFYDSNLVTTFFWMNRSAALAQEYKQLVM